MKVDKQQWLVFIDEQQKSGLSIAAFCRDKNINRKYFYYRGLKSNGTKTYAKVSRTQNSEKSVR